MRQPEKRWLLILAVLWAGVQVVATVGEFLRSWADFTSHLVQALGLDTVRWPVLSLAIHCAPLPLVLLLLGYAALWLNRLLVGGDTQPADRRAQSEPAVRRRNQVEKHLSRLVASLASGAKEAFREKPWWFVAFFGILLTLSIAGLELPLFISFGIGMCLLALSLASLVVLILSVADPGCSAVQLESRGLLMLSSIICLACFVTFHTADVLQILRSTPAVEIRQTEASDSPPASAETAQSWVEVIREFLTPHNGADAIRSFLVVFSALSGLAGALAARDSRMVGLILGAIVGGVIGVLMGSVVAVAMSFGTALVSIFP